MDTTLLKFISKETDNEDDQDCKGNEKDDTIEKKLKGYFEKVSMSNKVVENNVSREINRFNRKKQSKRMMLQKNDLNTKHYNDKKFFLGGKRNRNNSVHHLPDTHKRFFTLENEIHDQLKTGLTETYGGNFKSLGHKKNNTICSSMNSSKAVDSSVNKMDASGISNLDIKKFIKISGLDGNFPINYYLDLADMNM